MIFLEKDMPIKEIEDRNFYREAIDIKLPSAILITKNKEEDSLLKILEDLSKHFGECIKFFLLDATKNRMHEDLGITTFPAIVYFRETMEVERHLHNPTKEEIETVLKKLCKR